MEYFYIKLTIISLVNSLLLTLFVNTIYNSYFKKISINKKIIVNTLFYLILFIVLYYLNYLISKLGLTTLVFFNAALITISFFEMAIYLEKFFWDDFLGNSLPRSINLLISFVVMMNFGYFTLMFYIKILGISYYIS